jgi:dimethylamine monooxygenase subunit C
MLITGIKSKPVYAPLAPDLRGHYHLMVGRGVGGEPLLRVLWDLHAAAPGSGARTQVLFSASLEEQRSFGDKFRSTGAADVRLFGQDDDLLGDLQQVLSGSVMGTRLYVAGPESFIGRVMGLALQFNLNKDEIRAEECGSLARRVYCIHCRSATENVRTNIAQCSGCSRWLVVRDHYSRRLAAYMGVMVDAEVPGELPAVKETFP